MQFIDEVRVEVSSGTGGNGVITFRREKYVPKGGPDGGNGGRGGDVYIEASRNLSTLLDFRYNQRYAAANGNHGESARKTGRDGRDVTLRVPCGTAVYNDDTGKLIADLLKPDDTVRIARGGRGGKGNSEFATSTNQAPRFAEPGRLGETLHLRFELKLIADVGLVGFPNAGKSTLISRISAARPKIADYPFTTLIPHLGIARIGEGAALVVADIPGIIEGASMGKGLGLQFLRHIERTSVLVVLLDGTGDNVHEEYVILQKELSTYSTTLARKPRIIAISKIDACDSDRRRALSKLRFERKTPILISSVSGENIDTILNAMWKLAKAPVSKKILVKKKTTAKKKIKVVAKKVAAIKKGRKK